MTRKTSQAMEDSEISISDCLVKRRRTDDSLFDESDSESSIIDDESNTDE